MARGPARSCERYAIDFRGHTALAVERVECAGESVGPSWYGEGERDWYRIFRRDAMRAAQAPVKRAPGYVHPPGRVRWGVA